MIGPRFFLFVLFQGVNILATKTIRILLVANFRNPLHIHSATKRIHWLVELGRFQTEYWDKQEYPKPSAPMPPLLSSCPLLISLLDRLALRGTGKTKVLHLVCKIPTLGSDWFSLSQSAWYKVWTRIGRPGSAGSPALVRGSCKSWVAKCCVGQSILSPRVLGGPYRPSSGHPGWQEIENL